MPSLDHIALPLRHAAPVWLPRRAGQPERIALDPMITAVRVRGVHPDAFERRVLAIDPDAPGHEVLAFEGRLWRQLPEDRFPDAKPANLAQGAEVLAGDAWRLGPQAPFVPDAWRIDGPGLGGEAPMPPRSLERASLAMHEEARLRALHFAREDLVHDGRRFLWAMDMPLHPQTKARRTPTDWRRTDTDWFASFPSGRPDLAIGSFASQGYADNLVDEVRETRTRLARMQEPTLAGIVPSDHHFRHLVGKAPFHILGGLEMNKHRIDPAPADVAALRRMGGLGAIGGPVPDPAAALSLLGRTARLVASCGAVSRAAHRVFHLAQGVERHAAFMARELADAPLPDADADDLSTLAP